MKIILKQDNAQVVHFQGDLFFHQITQNTICISFFQTVNILYTNCCKKIQSLYLRLGSFIFFCPLNTTNLDVKSRQVTCT